VLDLGTGGGCILLALLARCPAACGVGVDLSAAALAVAEENAAAVLGPAADGRARAGFLHADFGAPRRGC
jgi:release factor glutamine methyltransferase